jgi:hypothetical protein
VVVAFAKESDLCCHMHPCHNDSPGQQREEAEFFTADKTRNRADIVVDTSALGISTA